MADGVRQKELDCHNQRRAHSISSSREAGDPTREVRAFVLAAQGDLRAEMLAEIFLKALPKIRRTVKKRKPPFIAKISRDGDITLLEF